MVLVSTLFVMVSSLLPGSTAGEDSVGIGMSDYQDGNWTLVVRRMDSPGLLAKSVRLTIYNWNGVIKLNRVSLIALTVNSSEWNLPVNNWQIHRAVYQCIALVCSPDHSPRYPPESTLLSVGDTMSVFKDAVAEHQYDPDHGAKWWGYQSGYSYALTSGSALLATGKL